jgi:signal transduction histidine kinase
MNRATLATRTFLLSFVPICLLLIGTFLAINSAIHERVRQDIRDGLYNSDQLLNRANAEFANENSALLTKLTDSAGLKASVGLLAEAKRDPSLERQVRATIEAQLREFQERSFYDYLAIVDLKDDTVAAIQDSGVVTAEGLGRATREGLADHGGVLFQFQSVPIEIGGEIAATLVLGHRFDLKRVAAGGEAALLRKGRIVLSTFSATVVRNLEMELLKHCSSANNGCEVKSEGKSYVVSALQREQLGDGYQLLIFRSLDEPLRTFNSAFLPQLIEVALCGIIFALISTIVTTRSVVRPLHLLASQLESGADSGTLPERLDAGNGVREIDLVASAFNRVAAAERRSRSELVVAKEAAEIANRLKTEFLTNISHELRTPINGVLGMTELLTTTGLNEEQIEYADVISESANDLVALIDGILDFSELETGRLRLKPTDLDLASILEDIGEVVRAKAKKKPITVEVSKGESTPVRYIGEDKRIRQVLVHLCDNAVKFTESGFIRISAQYAATNHSYGDLTFKIEDTGIGIAEGQQHFVFQPFTQVDGSLTRRTGGTGIGLSTAKALVELMGGKIGVKSVPGAGSTFWFTVPTDLAEVIADDTRCVEEVKET